MEIRIDFLIGVDDVPAAFLLLLAQVFPQLGSLLPKAAGHGPGAAELHIEELSCLRNSWTCAQRQAGAEMELPWQPLQLSETTQTNSRASFKRETGEKLREKGILGSSKVIITFNNTESDGVGEPSAIDPHATLEGATILRPQR